MRVFHPEVIESIEITKSFELLIIFRHYFITMSGRPPTAPTSFPPPPPPPPPKGPKENNDDDDDTDGTHPDMETPLMSHGSHRPRAPRTKGNTFQNNYSSIAEVADESSLHQPTNNSFSDDDHDFDKNTVDDDDKSLSNASISTATTVLTNFRDNLMLPFCSDETSLEKIAAGMASLTLIGILLGLVMPQNPALSGGWYRTFSSVIGYTYFVLWSVCFYPQVLLNRRRQSTKGLSNDFAVLNFMGWSFYTAYLASMYFDASIRELYQERFANESSTVQSNDVAFSVHAMTLSFIYLVQIVYYGDHSKGFPLKLKPQTWVLILGMGGPSVVMAALIFLGVLPYEKWLDYFYMLSFFKLCCTFTKYSKQVMLNFQRKSTSGWNIWYNFLECSGGGLSMLQVVLDSVDMNDMSGITGNMAKFILGLATIGFDVRGWRFETIWKDKYEPRMVNLTAFCSFAFHLQAIFFTQHYILYPEEPTSTDIPTSIIKPVIHSFCR